VLRFDPPHYTGRIKAVLFDWAGTVIDHGSCAPVEAFVESFRRAGVEITTAEARVPMGAAKLDHIRQILGMSRVNQAWQAAHGSAPTDVDAHSIYDQFLPVQLECLTRYGELIAGTLEVQQYCRERGIKIGTSSGYVHELMNVVMPLAKRQGFEPDAMFCASDVPQGRPAPWMNWLNAQQLGAYPASSVVVVDDTVVGVEAGFNAGMWAVGVTQSGNEFGLTADQLSQLSAAELQSSSDKAAARFAAAKAHYVIPSVANLPTVLDEIAQRLSRGESPTS
jgi:phosphonoacetaldehyde hydrolase